VAAVIQILALRETSRPGKKAEVWFERGLRATSVESLFADPYEHIKKVNESERWNIYYTVADCFEEPGRKLQVQHHIPFDVDGLEVGLDDDQLQLIARVICEAIGVPYEKCGVIFSGHGIQVIVGTTVPIEDVAEFDRDRAYYKAICDRIDLRLIQAKIRGKADRSVWSPARLMRFPLTENRKPDKPPIMGKLFNSTIERLDFTVRAASGIPEVASDQQISASIADAFPTPDTKAILDQEKGCKFLSWCQTHPEKVSEPEWYAMVSITARLDDGRKITHQMSQGHPGYSSEETDQKITQALEASGPRKCKNIEAIAGKCGGCIHRGTKLVSPLLIEGPDHVKTAKTGFRKVFFDQATGITTKKSIAYDDLIRQFYRDHPYVTVLGSAQAWEYTGTHFKNILTHPIEAYAYAKVDPRPRSSEAAEFAKQVRYLHLVQPEFFTEKVAGLMNFRNGVYDVRNGTFHPHSMQYGFRSTLACDYDVTAECPTFMKFMSDVTLGREELIEVLQEYLGYIFANEACKYQKALLLSGDGANGKSTLMEVVRALAGKDGASSISIKEMQDDQKRYLVEGKLVNIAEENSIDSFRDTEIVKNFVSGGRISVKKLYEQPYDYENQTKLVILFNKMPRSADDSHGFLRRFLIVPFDAVFDDSTNNKDIGMKDKLLAELPGIFNWIIKGYKRLEMQGRFTESKIVAERLREYQLEINPVNQFVTEFCTIDATNEVGIGSAKLYEDYKQWSDATGVKAHSMNSFVREIQAMIAKQLGHPKNTCYRHKGRGPDGKQLRMMRHVNCDYQSGF
jgi:P4 family phage/plasmid primase-like protien